MKKSQSRRIPDLAWHTHILSRVRSFSLGCSFSCAMTSDKRSSCPSTMEISLGRLPSNPSPPSIKSIVALRRCKLRLAGVVVLTLSLLSEEERGGEFELVSFFSSKVSTPVNASSWFSLRCTLTGEGLTAALGEFLSDGDSVRLATRSAMVCFSLQAAATVDTCCCCCCCPYRSFIIIVIDDAFLLLLGALFSFARSTPFYFSSDLLWILYV